MSKFRLIGGPMDGAEVSVPDDYEAALYIVSNLTGRWYLEAWYWPLHNGTAKHTRSAECEHVPKGAIYLEREVMEDPD